MVLTTYQVFYLFVNILSIYSIYKMMHVLLATEKVNRTKEILFFVAYYCIDTIVYFSTQIPLLSLITTIVCLFILTGLYTIEIKKRIFIAIFAYIVTFVAEMCTFFLTSSHMIDLMEYNPYSSEIGLFCAKLLTYIMALLIGRFKGYKKGEHIPVMYWLTIVLIPTASLYILMLLSVKQNIGNVDMVISSLLLLFINFAVFYLYDGLLIQMDQERKQIYLAEQNKSYRAQIQILEDANQRIHNMKHDMKNHLIAISSMVTENEAKKDDVKQEKLSRYVNELQETYQQTERFYQTENVIIDSILNHKKSEAVKRGIDLDAVLSIPVDFDPKGSHTESFDYDITILLGNLLDNAIEAIQKLKNEKTEKKIKLLLKYDKKRLFIRIENPYAGDLKWKNGVPSTTKEEKTEHGIGLQNVNQIVLKYDGKMDISTEQNNFIVFINLPVIIK